MAALYYPPSTNGLQKTLGAQLDQGVTASLTLNNATNIQNKPGVCVINRIDTDGNLKNPSLREFIIYTGTSGSTLTGLTRNADNSSSDQDHAVGSVVEFIPDVLWGQSVIDALANLVDTSTLAVDTTKVVTPTGTQTLTNKTHTSPVLNGSLTGTGIKDEDTMSSDSATAVPTQQSVKAYVDASIGSGLFTNPLINGAFDIWQRNTTFTPNDDVYIADRWNALVETNGAWTLARDTDVPSNTGMKYSLKATNVTLNNQCAIVQFIENVDAIKLAGKTVSLSFYAKTNSTEISNLRATILAWDSTADSVTSDVISAWASDGTDPTWATNWTAEVAGANKALTSSWQQFKVENVALDTANATNFAVVIWVDDGTIAANDDFYVTGVQLNTGATARSWFPRSFESELRACQRYYEKSYDYSVVPATSTTTGLILFNFGHTTNSDRTISTSFKATKRTTPTVTVYDSAGNSGKVSTCDNSTALTANVALTASHNIGTQGLTLRQTLAGPSGFGFHFVADAEL